MHKVYIFHIERKIDCRDDSQPIDENRQNPGKGKAGNEPEAFFQDTGISHPMQEGEKQGGKGYKHKLHTGAGWRNEKAQAVIYIACAFFIYKGNAA